MNTITTSLLIIAAYFIFELGRSVIEKIIIFKKMMSTKSFKLEYSDCTGLSDMIALYIVRNF